MKKNIGLFILALTLLTLVGCSSDAEIASYNLSKDADMFRINRRVVFYNGITDTFILSIEGRSSVEFYSDKFVVTVKTGENTFKKHYLGRSDNVFPFVEQLDNAEVGVYHYKVIFKPKSILPDVELVN